MKRQWHKDLQKKQIQWRINMNKETIKQIKKWIKDYELTQPGNVMIDEDTFDGSAYYLFQNILEEN